MSATVAAPDGQNDLGGNKSGKVKADKGKGAKKSAGSAEEEDVGLGKAKAGSRKGKVGKRGK